MFSIPCFSCHFPPPPAPPPARRPARPPASEIVCADLQHDAVYTVWAVDRREALLDLLQPEDLLEIQQQFAALDEDGSGSIDVNEIQRFLDHEYQDEEQRLR